MRNKKGTNERNEQDLII